ncbi:MAG: YiiX family permuted papain-like enzyme [Candidatus Cloacimonetes bacterium]|nr:YiiX family permuted papain-like enzyme [Candidatus Cloacimonadota bacterium]
MKKLYLILIFWVLLSSCVKNEGVADYRNGDIIFQTSISRQSVAIQIATKSEYSHMGIIYINEDGEVLVFEAVQPVKFTPVDEWIKRGKEGRYVLKRLKDSQSILTADALAKMVETGTEFIGKDYDKYFNWSDKEIYCSELVWKIYKRALGVEIGKLARLGDFDLSSEVVQEKMHERYSDGIPYDEQVISPGEMFNSEKLVMVKTNIPGFGL